MPQFLQADTEAHINTIRGAAPLYMQGFSDLTRRSHALLALMHQWGSIEYNASDLARIWKVMIYEPEVRTAADTTRKTFTNHDAYEELQVGIRGYEASDLLTEFQWKANQGRTQLINHYDQKLKNMAMSLKRRVQEWIYRDGDDAAYLNGYQGFESCLTAGNCVAGDKIAQPNDSYGGHPTDLANFGGTWSADIATADRPNANLANDWPYGTGSSEYDALSPLLVNWSSTAWASGTALWADNVEEVIRFTGAVMRSKNGYMEVGSNMPLVILMAPDLYEQAKNFYSTRQRIITPYSNGDMGFPVENIYIDGVMLRPEYAVPAGTAYVVCPQHLEMFNLVTMNGGGEDPMFDVFGPTWDEAQAAYLMRASTWGNLRLQPKFLGKISAIA